MSASALQRSVTTLRVRLAGAEPSDRQLLERFLSEQDQDAFAALVSRHQRPVLSALRKVLREPADVEDAFQATFLVLLSKAKQVRWQAGLGSWLYAVAHRVAVHSRAASARRAMMNAAAEPAAPGADLSCDEACLLLHKELDRLPERFRMPLLLCYLEGKSRDEAARQLGVPLSTVKGRLEQGRDMLRKRLLRRGVTLGVGLLGALAATPAMAVGLVERTVAAGVGEAPARVSALVRDVTAGAILSRCALTAVLVFVAMLPLYGAFAPERPAPDAPKKAAPVADEEGTLVGRVLDPGGKPVADAAVRLRRAGAAAKDAAMTRTDRDGRFKLTAPGLTEATLTARAPGFGADWLRVRSADAGRELTLRLAADDVVIEGRLRDLEGQPVADAEVRVENVGKPVAGNLDVYLKEWQNPERVLAGAPLLHEVGGSEVLDAPTARTDRQGWFRIPGVGRDRKVSLQIRGRGVATLFADAVTRKELTGKYPWKLHPAKFELLASPAKVIHGTVTEVGTGKPVPGVRVYGQRESVLTDAEGKFRLDGVEKATTYLVSVRAKEHFGLMKDVKDTAALDPVEVNFELRRGLALEGRLVERGTGKPVSGQVNYSARPDNPALKTAGNEPRDSRATAGKDGVFRLLVVPGQGYLSVQAHENRFARTAPAGWDGSPIDAVPYNVSPHYNHTTVEVAVDPEKPASLKATIELDPGAEVSGELVDGDGKQLSGVLAFGLTSVPDPGSRIFPRPTSFGPPPPARLPTAKFTAVGLDAKQPRHLVFVHPEKKLGKVVKVRGDEKGPISVRLEPWGAVAGTALVKKDTPAQGYAVMAAVSRKFADYRDFPIDLLETLPPPYRSRRSEVVWVKADKTGADGRFRVEGLIPGLKYDLFFAEGSLERERRPNYHTIKMSKEVEAGKTADVGAVEARRGE